MENIYHLCFFSPSHYLHIKKKGLARKEVCGFANSEHSIGIKLSWSTGKRIGQVLGDWPRTGTLVTYWQRSEGTWVWISTHQLTSYVSLNKLPFSGPWRLSSSMEETSLFSSSGMSLIVTASWSLYISRRLSWLFLSLKSSFGTIPVLPLHLGLDEPWTFSSQFQPEPTRWLNWWLPCVPVILIKDMAYCFCQFQVLADNCAATHYPNSNSSEFPPPLSPICTACHKMTDGNSKSLPLWEICVGSVTGCILKLQRRYLLSSNENQGMLS